ncbi:protein BIG GRAIN 1-like [Typha latifolia]|uniref:protein BIG GRAIN 1-like n=1 Tax=Typha latifolia TaxID=4733 RepID=UPI003C2CEADA
MQMDKWKKPPPPRSGYAYDHPSFSSTLLDAIYRSIDESDGEAPDRTAPVTAPKKHDSWRRPAVTERPVTKHKPEAPRKEEPEHRFRSFHSVRALNSTSSSSDSSSYGGFSSSEADSSHSARGKPIRTGSRSDPVHPGRIPFPAVAEKKKSSSIRSKIKELRRAKTPASPGARLASFLNSIFTSAAGNPKKAKPGAAEEFSSAPASACSTASSYSRSCLSKTPSTRGEKRSVRFYPVSVIVDEESRPCGEKQIYGRGDVAAEARKRVEELMKRFAEEEEEDDDDDDESDSSSDLFELENLTTVGGGGGGGDGGGGRRYRDELPVYGTTYLGTNRAISNSLIL